MYENIQGPANRWQRFLDGLTTCCRGTGQTVTHCCQGTGQLFIDCWGGFTGCLGGIRGRLAGYHPLNAAGGWCAAAGGAVGGAFIAAGGLLVPPQREDLGQPDRTWRQWATSHYLPLDILTLGVWAARRNYHAAGALGVTSKIWTWTTNVIFVGTPAIREKYVMGYRQATKELRRLLTGRRPIIDPNVGGIRTINPANLRVVAQRDEAHPDEGASFSDVLARLEQQRYRVFRDPKDPRREALPHDWTPYFLVAILYGVMGTMETFSDSQATHQLTYDEQAVLQGSGEVLQRVNATSTAIQRTAHVTFNQAWWQGFINPLMGLWFVVGWRQRSREANMGHNRHIAREVGPAEADHRVQVRDLSWAQRLGNFSFRMQHKRTGEPHYFSLVGPMLYALYQIFIISGRSLTENIEKYNTRAQYDQGTTWEECAKYDAHNHCLETKTHHGGFGTLAGPFESLIQLWWAQYKSIGEADASFQQAFAYLSIFVGGGFFLEVLNRFSEKREHDEFERLNRNLRLSHLANADPRALEEGLEGEQGRFDLELPNGMQMSIVRRQAAIGAPVPANANRRVDIYLRNVDDETVVIRDVALPVIGAAAVAVPVVHGGDPSAAGHPMQRLFTRLGNMLRLADLDIPADEANIFANILNPGGNAGLIVNLNERNGHLQTAFDALRVRAGGVGFHQQFCNIVLRILGYLMRLNQIDLRARAAYFMVHNADPGIDANWVKNQGTMDDHAADLIHYLTAQNVIEADGAGNYQVHANVFHLTDAEIFEVLQHAIDMTFQNVLHNESLQERIGAADLNDINGHRTGVRECFQSVLAWRAVDVANELLEHLGQAPAPGGP